MSYTNAFADEAQPICPACGVTMHPLLDEGIRADECRECGFQVEWPAADSAREGDDEERDTRWD